MLRLVGSEDSEVQIAAATTIRHIRKLALTAEKFHYKEMYSIMLIFTNNFVTAYNNVAYHLVFSFVSVSYYRNTLAETDYQK